MHPVETPALTPQAASAISIFRARQPRRWILRHRDALGQSSRRACHMREVAARAQRSQGFIPSPGPALPKGSPKPGREPMKRLARNTGVPMNPAVVVRPGMEVVPIVHLPAVSDERIADIRGSRVRHIAQGVPVRAGEDNLFPYQPYRCRRILLKRLLFDQAPPNISENIRSKCRLTLVLKLRFAADDSMGELVADHVERSR